MDELTEVQLSVRAMWPVPVADATEARDISAIRHRLTSAMAQAPSATVDATRGRRGWRQSVRLTPVLVSCVVAVVVGVAAIVLLRPERPKPVTSLAGPAAGPAADGLIARLAVLRRMQTRADRLPADLPALLRRGGEAVGAGRIIPSLSRLVATPSGARIYLVVTTPAAGTPALWSPRLGDQVTIVAITARGATEQPGIPAVELSDSGQLQSAGITFNAHVRPPRRAVNLSDAYDVAIVPDGVVRVRWTFATPAGAAGQSITAPVHENVALTHLTRRTTANLLLHGTRYAADGHVIASDRLALARAQAHERSVERRQALRAIARAHVTVPHSDLAPFALFSYHSRAGTLTPDGYLISQPPVAKLPVALLTLAVGAGAEDDVDVHQIRYVRAPSGLAMWVLPTPSGLCFSITGIKYPYGQALPSGDGCSGGGYAQADTQGTGESDSSRAIHGSIVLGVLPRTMHTVSIPTGVHQHRVIHPAAGVYLVTTPFKIG